MTPRHHLPDELLLAYAIGGLSDAESLLVAVHASLCPSCARKVQQHERVAGALLAAGPAADIGEDLLTKTLARLDEAPVVAPPPPVKDPILPSALARITGPIHTLKWKQALPFIANCFSVDLPMSLNGIPVQLRRFRPGTMIPNHCHHAPESDLILTGALIDERTGNRFERGDVSMNDETVTHQLRIDEGDWCVALSVNAGRAKPVGLLARYVFGYTGW